MAVTIPNRAVLPRPKVMPIGFREAAPLAVMLAMRLASGPTADFSYLVLAGYALFGRAHAIRALGLSWLFTMINPGLAPEVDAATVGRHAVLFAAAASAMLHGNLRSGSLHMRPFAFATLLLGLFIALHSMLFSPMADVSVLKATAWVLATATSVSLWSGLSGRQGEKVARQFFQGLVVILLASLPLAAAPLGYLRNGTGFQGILNHPQAFGATMALLCAWAMARLLAEERPRWSLFAVAGASLACIFLSEARTAGLALGLGVALAVSLGPILAREPVRHALPGLRSARFWMVAGMVIAAGASMAPAVVATVQNYVTKSGRAQAGGVEVTGLLQAYDRSRGRVVDAMLDNIGKHPLTGMGFGIASEPALMEVKRDPVLGLPVGASVEKGVVPLMVLEELGIFGAVLVALWLLPLLRASPRGGVAALAVCLTALLLNMGEAILFSPGGMGLLPLILFGWAYSCGSALLRKA